MIRKTPKGAVCLHIMLLPRTSAKRSRIVPSLRAEKESSQANNRESVSRGGSCEDMEQGHQGVLELSQDAAPLREEGRILPLSLSSPTRLFIGWIKGVVPQPAPSTLILSAGLYLVAVCATLERQQGKHWLSLLLESKMPGLTVPYQETSWESFENIMCGYTNREEYQEHAQIDLSKNRALLRLLSPWNKQVRRSFTGLFLGQPPLSSTTEGEPEGSRPSQTGDGNIVSSSGVLSWYRIDACTPANRVIVSSRGGDSIGTNRPLGLGPSVWEAKTASPSKPTGTAYLVSPLALQQEGAKGGGSVGERILPFYYVLPGQAARVRAPLENDSIPAKLESPYDSISQKVAKLSLFGRVGVGQEGVDRALQASDCLGGDVCLEAASPSRVFNPPSGHSDKSRLLGQGALPTQQELASRLQTGRESSIGRDWAHFQNALKEAFYVYGLLPPPNWEVLNDSIAPPETGSALLTPHIKEGGGADEVAAQEALSPLGERGVPATDAKRPPKSRAGGKVHSGRDGTNDRLLPESTLPETTRGSAGLEGGLGGGDDAASQARALLEGIQIQSGDGLLASQEALNTRFLPNELLPNRFMSGYKFAGCNQSQTRSLYAQHLLPRLGTAFWHAFSAAQLQDMVTQTALRIELPPGLPHSFCQGVFQRRFGDRLAGDGHKALRRGVRGHPTYQHGAAPNSPPGLWQGSKRGDAAFASNTWRDENLLVNYRPICLEELREVVQAFERAGHDYKQYASQPKDAPAAIAISPSLEDDKLIQLRESQAASTDGGDLEAPPVKTKPTKLERLLKARERGRALEEAKELHAFAYQNRLALYPTRSNLDLPNPRQLDINSWILSRLGANNMQSDRKYAFFGRSNVLAKRLVAKEQEDINKQILGGARLRRDGQEPVGMSRGEPLLDLQARARRDLVDLLSEPDLRARDAVGFEHRHHKQDPRLRGSRLRLPHLDSFWQRKKMRSTLLGAPSKRYVVMPTITQDDWKQVVEWQCREYLYAEDKRLQPHMRRDPEKTFKIKRVNVYLPWATLRTPLEKPFEWPITRLDLVEPQHCLPKPRATSTYRWRAGMSPGGMRGKHNRCHPSAMYKAANYWTIRNRYTLSSREDSTQLGGLFAPPASQAGGRKMGGTADRSTRKIINRHLLFEPLSRYSWLLVYQLLLTFLLKDVLKYIYRVQLKSFVLALLRSEIGIAITSPEFREHLEHGPPRSFYTPTKRLQDVAVPEDTIPVLSEVIWFLRNAGRTRAQIRGLLIDGPSGAEKTSLVQAIAGEAQVPVIVQSMSSLLFTYNQPYEKLENVFALARKKAPCVLFLDSLDEIGRSRDNVVRNDRGTADLPISLDVERGATRLRFAQIDEGLQQSHLSRNNPYLLSRWNPESQTTSTSQVEGVSDEARSPDAARGGPGRREGSACGVSSAQAESEGRRIHLLLRLLTEIDGVRPLNGVIIIATSERTSNLDPALLRPGRFDRLVHLQLPNHKRRIQLFKNETERLGAPHTMPWDYLGIRTATWSATDIISAINHSAIRAILDDTAHTIETLEHGISCVAGAPLRSAQTDLLSRSDPFHASRLAYYQAGKGLVQSLLLDHPQIGFLSLVEPLYQNDGTTGKRGALQIEQRALQGGLRYWEDPERTGVGASHDKDLSVGGERRSTNRWDHHDQARDNTPLEPTHTISSPRTRLDIETRLIGLYAGKAGELLHISSRSTSPIKDVSGNSTVNRRDAASNEAREGSMPSAAYLWQSDLGFAELFAASSLINHAVARCYLYSQKITTFKTNRVIGSLNRSQVSDQDVAVFQRLSQELRSNSAAESVWGRLGRDRRNTQQASSGEAQARHPDAPTLSLASSTQGGQERTLLWQQRVCQGLEMSERPYGKWYRLYLPKVEEGNRNEEWVPPDLVFHQPAAVASLNKKGFEATSSAKTINDLYTLERDTLSQNMVMSCFYAAFHLLHENRELLDVFADHLIRFQILRAHEIVRTCSAYLQPPTPKGDPAQSTDIGSNQPVGISRGSFEAIP